MWFGFPTSRLSMKTCLPLPMLYMYEGSRRLWLTKVALLRLGTLWDSQCNIVLVLDVSSREYRSSYLSGGGAAHQQVDGEALWAVPYDTMSRNTR